MSYEKAYPLSKSKPNMTPWWCRELEHIRRQTRKHFTCKVSHRATKSFSAKSKGYPGESCAARVSRLIRFPVCKESCSRTVHNNQETSVKTMEYLPIAPLRRCCMAHLSGLHRSHNLPQRPKGWRPIMVGSGRRVIRAIKNLSPLNRVVPTEYTRPYYCVLWVCSCRI